MDSNLKIRTSENKAFLDSVAQSAACLVAGELESLLVLIQTWVAADAETRAAAARSFVTAQV